MPPSPAISCNTLQTHMEPIDRCKVVLGFHVHLRGGFPPIPIIITSLAIIHPHPQETKASFYSVHHKHICLDSKRFNMVQHGSTWFNIHHAPRSPRFSRSLRNCTGTPSALSSRSGYVLSNRRPVWDSRIGLDQCDATIMSQTLHVYAYIGVVLGVNVSIYGTRSVWVCLV